MVFCPEYNFKKIFHAGRIFSKHLFWADYSELRLIREAFIDTRSDHYRYSLGFFFHTNVFYAINILREKIVKINTSKKLKSIFSVRSKKIKTVSIIKPSLRPNLLSPNFRLFLF